MISIPPAQHDDRHGRWTIKAKIAGILFATRRVGGRIPRASGLNNSGFDFGEKKKNREVRTARKNLMGG